MLSDLSADPGNSLRLAAHSQVWAQAVLHHVASQRRRLRLLRELARVLRPGGRALLTVWASEQEDVRKLAKCGGLGL